MDLIFTNICHIIVENDTLKATLLPPSQSALVFFALFSLLGLLSVIYGLIRLRRGGDDAAISILSGVHSPVVSMGCKRHTGYPPNR